MAYPTTAPRLGSMATFSWQVATFDGLGRKSDVSNRTSFHLAASPADWKVAAWLGDNTSNVYRTQVPHVVDGQTMLYVCGLGFSVVSLNGKDLNTLTTSPWTNNGEVNGFSTFALSSSSAGTAAAVAADEIVVSLGNGWRDPIFTVHDSKDAPKWGAHPRMLRAMVVATFANGSTTTLSHTGDGSWKAAKGPSTYDSVYNGEHYDARVAHALFASSSSSSSMAAPPHEESSSSNLWARATVASGPGGEMVAWATPPVDVLATVSPVKITNPKPRIYVVDFGERRAGVTRLQKVPCASGETIVMRHAEIMQHGGLPDLKGHVDPTMVYVGNLRSAQQTDVYTCAGAAGGEIWAPKLTYHGYRFLEVNVTAAPSVGSIRKEDVAMVHFATKLPQRAFTNFTSASLNKLQDMAFGAQRSNLMTVPTDCDQRDERLGWMGDLNLSGESMMLNFDGLPFFQWWVKRVALPELGADGSLPDVSPYVRFGGRPGDVSWSTALPTALYQLWKAYGDIGTYKGCGQAAMDAHLANLAKQAAAGLGKMHTSYGDWCPPPAKIGGGQGIKPSMPLTSAFSYVSAVQQTASMANAAGNASAAANYTALAKHLVAEYNTAFYKGSGVYDTGTQTALTLSLDLGAATGVDLSATRDALLKAIAANATHSTTGIIGSSKLYQMLDAAKAHGTALSILSQTDYPSFGFEFANTLEKTTTNLWELPDAPGEGTGMNSRNHHMYSSFSAYLVQSVAGVGQAAGSAGFAELELRPSSARALRGASTTLRLAHGDVHFSWVRSGGAQRDKVTEGDTARLDCGAHGGRIVGVRFASFGTPRTDGEDGVGMVEDGECHISRSKAIVEGLCVGRTSCAVEASQRTFADTGVAQGELGQCSAAARTSARGVHADPLRLWVEVQCEKPDAIEAAATIPIGSQATMRLPLRDMATPTLVDEEGAILYHEGDGNAKMPKKAAAAAAAAGVAVDRVVDEQVGDALRVTFGAGEYGFVLAEEAGLVLGA